MPVVKVREAITRLLADGWYLVSQEGSNQKYKHPVKPGKVTVAGKPSDDLTPGQWLSIQRQAGWR
ncbi:MAG: type II toxin-antitoxin system HicA family toxin [Thermomicrobiales bacterium]